jgi:hypothetical protein
MSTKKSTHGKSTIDVPADPYTHPELVSIPYRDTAEFKETLEFLAREKRKPVMKVIRELLRRAAKDEVLLKKRA